MLPYLINATAIWSLSLLVYLLALRRQTFHGYNRLFLLLTLLMGLLLPLVPAPGPAGVYAAPVQVPVARLAAEWPQPAAAVTPARPADIPWLALIYTAGACFMLLRLARDGVRLIRLYRKGRKYRAADWLVVETGEWHSPFSFRRLLFVSSRSAYTEDQWQMILDHEGQHARLGHSADLVLLQLLRIVGWFHPLVHCYQYQLLLVHEYEADARVPAPLASYGRFLVEQALLQGAPSLAHSFNRSPIKNRIAMLSRITGRHQYARLFLAIPLTLVSVCCFMKSGYAQQGAWHGNVLSYRGNKIEMKITPPPKDHQGTFRLTKNGEDAAKADKQEEIVMITFQPDTTPARLNGQPIYRQEEVKAPVLNGTAARPGDYLLDRLKPLLDELPDGKRWQLDISNLIIDERGKVVYFRYGGVRNTYGFSEPAPQKASEAQQRQIEEKVFALLYDHLTFTPATKNGKPVPCVLDGLGKDVFSVANRTANVR